MNAPSDSTGFGRPFGPWLDGVEVLVLGLGDSGLAMAQWCAGCGAQVRVWDSREAPPQAAALAAAVPQARRLDGALVPAMLDGAGLVLKSPGLAPGDARIAELLAAAASAGIPVQGELDLFARALADLKADRGYAPKLIAITGTNGKTTTTAMTAKLVERCGRRVAVAGNIGPSLLGVLAEALAREPAPAGGDEAAEELASDEAAGDPTIASANDAAAANDANDAAAANDSAGAALAKAGLAAGAEASGVDATSADDSGNGGGNDREGSDRDSDSNGSDPTVEASIARPPEDDELPLRLVAPPPPAPVFEHLPEVWVLELSSFQLDRSSGFDATAATVLNLTQDHLDWHGSIGAYAQAKGRVYAGSGTMVVNRDDAEVEALAETVTAPPPATGKGARTRAPKPVPRRIVRFGLDAPRRPGDFGLVNQNGIAWLVRAHEADETLGRRRGAKAAEAEPVEISLQRLMPADALRIRGRHNASNALAALALATAAGCPLAPMLHALRDYAGEPHRVELVMSLDEVDAFDDSKGTNVGATVAAIDGLGADRAPNRLVLLLGGDGKGQDFAPLAAPVRRHARAVATFGRDAARIEAALARSGVPLQRHETLEAATRWAFAQAAAGDAVLLSPACASLDMFRNYKHRAEVFVAEVQALAQERGVFA